jgi:hypothetical protein
MKFIYILVAPSTLYKKFLSGVQLETQNKFFEGISSEPSLIKKPFKDNEQLSVRKTDPWLVQ